MNVTTAKNWPCGQVRGKSHKFSILDSAGNPKELTSLKDGEFVKIKTHNTTFANYEYAYSSDKGWIYFDLFSSNEKQCWKLHKDGDKVAFENAYWPGYWIGIHDNWMATQPFKVWWTQEKGIFDGLNIN